MNEIVFLLPQLKNGGGVRVFVELANILCEWTDVTIIVPNNSDEEMTFKLNDKIKLVVLGTYDISKVQKIRNIFSVIKAVNKTYSGHSIILTDPIMSLLSIFIRGERTYRFMQADDYRIFDDGLLLRNKIVVRIYKFLTLLSYLYPTKFIFNSKFTHDSFIKLRKGILKKSAVPFHCVHPSINHDVFKSISGPVHDRLQICLVARKHPSKGLVTFQESWGMLAPHIKKKISRVVLISHDDLSIFDLTGFEVFSAKDDFEIARILQQSDIFISTSWAEGFGLPPLEAMACGCAVITSASQGINEYARDNENCLIYPPKNSQALTDKLNEMICNPELRAKLTYNAINDAKSFNWHKSALNLKKILEGDVKNA